MKIIISYIEIIIIVFLLATPKLAFAWAGKVISVQDGDTFTVERANGSVEKIRLFGIDSPERSSKGRWKAQPYSAKAKTFLQSLVTAENDVYVAVWEMEESYTRIVAGVITMHDGITIQEELVRAGLAWVDHKYCKRSIRECKKWMVLEKEAIANRVGLWKDLDSTNKPVAPWVWRGKNNQASK